jgi:hypothetical protein
MGLGGSALGRPSFWNIQPLSRAVYPFLALQVQGEG